MTESTEHQFTRRRLLGGAALATGAGMAAVALPPNVRKALAAPIRHGSGSLRDIEHVVLLMQENRSFDHYFGTFRGVRGFSDPHAKRLSNGRSVFYQPDPSNPKGYLLPYHLDSHSTAAQAIPSTSHAWEVQHGVWNGGKMDNWLPAHIASDGADVGPYTMGYFDEADIPFQRALADAFTICDNYHCSVLGPTNANRVMWQTGTLDPNGKNGGPVLENSAKGGVYSWTTYAERLESAGVSWKCYQTAIHYNMAQYFKQYANAPTTSPLYTKGLALSQPGQFEYDALNDKLPTVSWVFPNSSGESEHPDFLPNAGAAFVASKIDAVAANPEVWAKTVFILSYDENDGMFDHVEPPTPPAGTTDEFVTVTSPGGTDGAGLPIGPGFRVPCIIVSPWTAGGFVCSEPFDHTSQLRFLEQLTGVMEPNITGYRRKALGDLTSAFRFNQKPAQPPVLPDTSGPLQLAQFETATLPLPEFPGADQTPPKQDPGHRPQVG